MQIFKAFRFHERDKVFIPFTPRWYSLTQLIEWMNKYEKEPEKVMVFEYENTTYVGKCRLTKILNLNLVDLPYSLKEFEI